MKYIGSFFAHIFTGIKSLFTPAGQKKVMIALGQAESLVQQVLPVVEAIAIATPNKTDDEIIAVIKKYAVPVTIPSGPMTDADKGAPLLQAAVTAAEIGVSAATGVPTSVLILAGQLAYTALRSATR